MDCNCPRCGSENTQRLTLLIASNTQATVSRSGTVAYSPGTRLFAASTHTSGISASGAAMAAKPPQRPSRSIFPIILFCLVGLCFLNGLGQGRYSVAAISAFFMVVIGGIWFLLEKSYRASEKAYFSELAEWRRKFACLRCSHVFTVDMDTTEGASLPLSIA